MPRVIAIAVSQTLFLANGRPSESARHTGWRPISQLMYGALLLDCFPIFVFYDQDSSCLAGQARESEWRFGAEASSGDPDQMACTSRHEQEPIIARSRSRCVTDSSYAGSPCETFQPFDRPFAGHDCQLQH